MTNHDHIDHADLTWAAVGSGPSHWVCRVHLEPGQSAWNPASTRHLLYGPADLVYRRYPDGGVEVHER